MLKLVEGRGEVVIPVIKKLSAGGGRYGVGDTTTLYNRQALRSSMSWQIRLIRHKKCHDITMTSS